MSDQEVVASLNSVGLVANKEVTAKFNSVGLMVEKVVIAQLNLVVIANENISFQFNFKNYIAAYFSFVRQKNMSTLLHS